MEFEANEQIQRRYQAYEPPRVDQRNDRSAGRLFDCVGWLRNKSEINGEEYDAAERFRADFELGSGLSGLVMDYGERIGGAGGTPAGQSVVVVDIGEERARMARTRAREVEMAIRRPAELRVLVMAAVEQRTLSDIGRAVFGHKDRKVGAAVAKYALISVLAELAMFYRTR